MGVVDSGVGAGGGFEEDTGGDHDEAGHGLALDNNNTQAWSTSSSSRRILFLFLVW